MEEEAWAAFEEECAVHGIQWSPNDLQSWRLMLRGEVERAVTWYAFCNMPEIKQLRLDTALNLYYHVFHGGDHLRVCCPRGWRWWYALKTRGSKSSAG